MNTETDLPAPEALAALVDVLLAEDAPGADRTALEEDARLAFADERPGALPDHWWLAVPGATYEAAFEVLGLHDRIPVTVHYGLASQEYDEKYTPEAVHRVFITPEYAGWRLIYAETPLRETTWWPHEVIERLSAACGQAQVYYQDPFADSVIWATAEHGTVRRGYWRDSAPEWTGDPLPWEEVLAVAESEDEEDYEDVYPEPNASEVHGIGQAAAHLSVNPATVTADTPARGHGWLALTAPGAGHDGFGGSPRL
ncbi:hypothetical protein [Streptomyces sp. CB01881]|uniref:hypothetical protein n=1 Tax=Streptomyces sp. CB01881 TaxID=2078691 RepID=UPI000CDC0812|nr:hypothetical protein [Streptomyces sp. CB01881]AUY52471.1 hypothetical protein C2142_30145 [Streptomyces sp. CB01881]TYC71898.1 hypothetical protein EH183_30125 [Streptomyces sp. CB01881]